MATIIGDNGKNTLIGTNSKDIIVALDEDDIAAGLGGNDSIDGGDGNDSLFGGTGNDTILGGLGADLIHGGAGNDLIGLGDNSRNASPGTGAGDVLYGDGFNNFTLVGGSVVGQDPVGETQRGDDVIYGTADGDTIYGDNGDGSNAGGHDTILAGSSADTIYGEGGNDSISGEGGNDLLSGGDGKDTLLGGEGNDILIGGAAGDVIDGGAGDDRIVYNAVSDSSGNKNDTIHGFASGFNYASGDKIDITALGGPGSDLQWTGSIVPSPSGIATVWYQAVAGGVKLLADVDGDGATDFQVLVQGVSSLRHSDILGVINSDLVVIGGGIHNEDDPVIEVGVTPGDATASGVIVLGTDNTDGEGDRVVIANPGIQLGAYGSIAIAADGSWTYTLDNGDPDTDALHEGQIVTDEFSMAWTDGLATSNSLPLLIRIEGRNDAPTIDGAHSGSVQEDVTLAASGVLTAQDVDSGATQTWSIEGSATGAFGSLALNGNTGEWTYTLANDSSAVQSLAAGESHEELFTIRVTDDWGVFEELTVTVAVTGSHDSIVSGRITLVSTNANGEQGNSDSATPSFSSDGTRIVFNSDATNLVAGGTNGLPQIFVKSLVTGEVTLVSTDASGNEGIGISENPVFSPDGSKVAFLSRAENLVVGDTNGAEDIFVKDLNTGAIERASTNGSGGQADGDSFRPVFSPDGSKLAFQSFASNLVAGDTNVSNDVFVKDLSTGAVTRVSTDSFGAQANSYSFEPRFSGDGSKVVFFSYASNLVAGDTNGGPDVFVKDLLTGNVVLASTSGTGDQGNAFSTHAVISPDGSKVAFYSEASNLVAGDTNGWGDIFLKDLATGAIERVNTDSLGAEANSLSLGPAFSPDGSEIAFISFASNLVEGDTNAQWDLFIKDLETGVTIRVSTDAIGTEVNQFSFYEPVFSPDGSAMAFHSLASNLVPGDTNESYDVFIKQLALSGGTGSDAVVGGIGNDTLIGAAGDDTLTGGAGGDLFVWQLGDQGAPGTPATDTITDFVDAGDALELSDLLVGESHSGTNPGNLDDYLDFSLDSGNTTVSVKTGGSGAADQVIALNGVDLVTGTSSDSEIISDLLSAGRLITD